MIKYSATHHTCYDMTFDYKVLPGDLVEITKEEHQLFMGNGIEEGKRLKANKHPFALEDIPEPTEEELSAIAEAEAENARSEAMLLGFEYKGYKVSVTKGDGDALLQVKAAFEFGLNETIIHFKNGVNMPITSTEFNDFALAFVTERNKYFIG